MLIKKLRFSVPLLLFLILLLLAGILAITQEQETEEDEIFDDSDYLDMLSEDMPSDFEEPLPEWIPPGPPRWFRSNAGGMALEEIPSRLAALRNKYALVIDYIAPEEMEPRLLPFYNSDYTVEIRVLYEQGKELRRQWLFKDEQGVTRLNAVFKPIPDETVNEPEETESGGEVTESADESNTESIAEGITESDTESITKSITDETSFSDSLAADVLTDNTAPDNELPPALAGDELGESVGFIEIYGEKTYITDDYWLFADGGEIRIAYFYIGNTLVKTETYRKTGGDEYRLMYTDRFRYNRSFSLRNVERFYHISAEAEPVRLLFPNRVLEAASNSDFLSDKLFVSSGFLENYAVKEGYRMTYDTDSRGRILTQTMFDDRNEEVWVITNTWSGDRIVAARKIEGKNEKLTEYEYDGKGNRVIQRDINNGVLERLVYTQDKKETEELYLNGAIVLRAYWEDGRKIHEERVRQ